MTQISDDDLFVVDTSGSLVSFVVWGVPVAQPRQRHRMVKADDKTYVSNYTPARHPVQAFKQACKIEARSRFPFEPRRDCSLRLHVLFVLPRPQSLIWKTKPMPRVPHNKKPDIDNLLKSLKDALTGILWHDDSQIASVIASKVIASGSGNDGPHVRVALEVMR